MGSAMAQKHSTDESLPDEDFPVDVVAPPVRRLTDRNFALLLVVAGAVAFAASMALAIEKYLKLLNPDRLASCSFNLFLDCADAMASSQGALLGFPNPLIGVAVFPVVVTTGVVVLAGGNLPRWFYRALGIGMAVGMVFVVFLMYTSVHVLQRLCPYCMVVWAMMIPLAWYTLVWLVQEEHVRVSDSTRRFMVNNRLLLLPLFFLAVVVWILLGMGDVIAMAL